MMKTWTNRCYNAITDAIALIFCVIKVTLLRTTKNNTFNVKGNNVTVINQIILYETIALGII